MSGCSAVVSDDRSISPIAQASRFRVCCKIGIRTGLQDDDAFFLSVRGIPFQFGQIVPVVPLMPSTGRSSWPGKALCCLRGLRFGRFLLSTAHHVMNICAQSDYACRSSILPGSDRYGFRSDADGRHSTIRRFSWTSRLSKAFRSCRLRSLPIGKHLFESGAAYSLRSS